MASQIRTIVAQSMRQHGLGGNTRQAEPVIADLERAEATVVQSLIQFATGQGLDRRQAEDALRAAGLNVEQPVQQGWGQNAQAGEGGDTNAILARMEGTLNGLVAFARQNGYTG